MDHIQILKQSLQITWRYRALWVFGILVALTSARGNGNQGRYTIGEEEGFPGFPGDIQLPEIPPQVVGGLVAVLVGLLAFVIILALAGVVVRYVASTALIRMVDDYARTGEKRTVRWGIGRGWSRTAWRLFLIDLLIGLPVAVAFIVLFVVALAPLLLWITGDETAGIVGTLATVATMIPLILLLIAVSVALSLLSHFFWRACALEEVGVIEAIRRGYGLVRRNLKDVGLMWLMMVGLGIGWLLLLIPAMILLVLMGLVIAGLPALLVGGLASMSLEGAAPWILGAVVGLPVLILVVAIPALFLEGLAEIFRSTVWTLTYRSLHGLEAEVAEAGRLPGSEAPGLQPAPISR